MTMQYGSIGSEYPVLRRIFWDQSIKGWQMDHMCAVEINPAKGVLKHVTRAVPEPAANEVLIRVKAVSLNYRDLLVARNFYNSSSDETLIPVSDGVGEIVKTGTDVSPARLGQRVAGAFFPDWIGGPVTAQRRARSLGAQTDGVLAEYAILTDHAAIQVPQHLTDEEAATLPCAGVTAWAALTDAAVLRPGMDLLLQGSGGVSVMALQLAQTMGVRVIHTTSTDEKAARLKSLGADVVVNYKQDPDWHLRVLEITQGRGVNAILDVGGAATLPKSAQAVRVGGTIACVGFLSDGAGLDPKVVVGRAIRLIGVTVGSCEMFEGMNRAITRTKMRPVVDRVFPIQDTVAAYDWLEQGKHFGKIVIAIPA